MSTDSRFVLFAPRGNRLLCHMVNNEPVFKSPKPSGWGKDLVQALIDDGCIRVVQQAVTLFPEGFTTTPVTVLEVTSDHRWKQFWQKHILPERLTRSVEMDKPIADLSPFQKRAFEEAYRHYLAAPAFA